MRNYILTSCKHNLGWGCWLKSGSCSLIGVVAEFFLYWVVRDIVCIVRRLCIINSLSETACFLLSYNVPIGSQELGCGSKTRNHRTGAPFTCDVIDCDVSVGQSSFQGNFCIETAVTISRN